MGGHVIKSISYRIKCIIGHLTYLSSKIFLIWSYFENFEIPLTIYVYIQYVQAKVALVVFQEYFIRY